MRTLHLDRTNIVDLAPLKGMTQLTKLDLFDTFVRNIAPLSSLINLRSISLHDTDVTNMAPLSGLTDLIYLDLNLGIDIAPLINLTHLVIRQE
jgi:Leucine-rich repeat (LRR) protein